MLIFAPSHSALPIYGYHLAANCFNGNADKREDATNVEQVAPAL